MFFDLFQIKSAYWSLPPSSASPSGMSRAPGVSDTCETLCDGQGCHCLADGDGLRSVDHVLVKEAHGGNKGGGKTIGCLCGEFTVGIGRERGERENSAMQKSFSPPPLFSLTKVQRI